MIIASILHEIVAVYIKHCWVLRRVLLSPQLRDSSRTLTDAIGNAEVVYSDVDALWFSRPPVTNGVPWEIRHLNAEPYARLFKIDEFAADFEDALASAEEQFRRHIMARKEA